MAGLADSEFLDASRLFGAGWQTTKLSRSERGEFFTVMRPHREGFQRWIWGDSPDAVMRQCLELVASVAELQAAIDKHETAYHDSRAVKNDASASPALRRTLMTRRDEAWKHVRSALCALDMPA